MDSSGVLGIRVAKIVAWSAAGIVGLAALGLLGVWLFVNPNDYKGRIVSAVKGATGRDLILVGDIHLSVFPRIALELGPAQFGNPPGFGAEPFLAFKQAAVRAQLWPLLRGRLAIDFIELDGLDLRLMKDSGGRGNWEGLITGPSALGAAAAGGVTATQQEGRGPSPMFEGLAGLRIRDSRVSYQDLRFENLNLEIGRYAEDTVVPIAIRFQFARGPSAGAAMPTVAGTPVYPLTVGAKWDLRMDATAQRIRLTTIAVDGELRLTGHDKAIAWTLAVPAVEVNLVAQTLGAPVVALEFGGAELSAGVQGTRIIDNLTLDGTLTLAPLRVREFLAKLSVDNPKTRDPQALAQLAGSGRFDYGANAARVDDLVIALDQTRLTGRVDIVDLSTFAMTFDLAADRVELDRYLEPDGTPPDPKHLPFELPTAALKALNANGTVTLQSARVAGVEFKNLMLSVESKAAEATTAAERQIRPPRWLGKL
jgi:AsmA protein